MYCYLPVVEFLSFFFFKSSKNSVSDGSLSGHETFTDNAFWSSAMTITEVQERALSLITALGQLESISNETIPDTVRNMVVEKAE